MKLAVRSSPATCMSALGHKRTLHNPARSYHPHRNGISEGEYICNHGRSAVVRPQRLPVLSYLALMRCQLAGRPNSRRAPGHASCPRSAGLFRHCRASSLMMPMLKTASPPTMHLVLLASRLRARRSLKSALLCCSSPQRQPKRSGFRGNSAVASDLNDRTPPLFRHGSSFATLSPGTGKPLAPVSGDDRTCPIELVDEAKSHNVDLQIRCPAGVVSHTYRATGCLCFPGRRRDILPSRSSHYRTSSRHRRLPSSRCGSALVLSP